MRVNVTYSIKLEEVSKLVSKILHETETQLKDLTTEHPEIIYSVVEDQNEKKAVELIKKFRQDLLDLEHRLGDCENILIGYQQTLLQLASTTEEGETKFPETENIEMEKLRSTQDAMEKILATQKQAQEMMSSLQPPQEAHDSPSG